MWGNTEWEEASIALLTVTCTNQAAEQQVTKDSQMGPKK